MELKIDKSYKEDNELCFEISNSELMSDIDKKDLLNSELIVDGFGKISSSELIPKLDENKKDLLSSDLGRSELKNYKDIEEKNVKG